jgi:hypothetical protein
VQPAFGLPKAISDMAESVSQKVSLVGQVIEDLTFEPLDFQRFSAELYQGPKEKLVRVNQTPHYKDNGYFAFTDVGLGDYTLQILGERFQTQQITVTLAPTVIDQTKNKLPQLLAQVIFDQPGDNELIVLVDAVNNSRITFEDAIIRKRIRAGATVIANGGQTRLTKTLEPGKITSARLDSVAGINAGDLVRIIRDRSIRLRFDPYYEELAESTRIVGTASIQGQPGITVPNAFISVEKVNGTAVTISDVAGAKVATGIIGGSVRVLGTERDLQALTNASGDYTIYFNRADIVNVTLKATRAGFQTLSTPAIALTPQKRNRADLQLTKI